MKTLSAILMMLLLQIILYYGYGAAMGEGPFLQGLVGAAIPAVASICMAMLAVVYSQSGRG